MGTWDWSSRIDESVQGVWRYAPWLAATLDSHQRIDVGDTAPVLEDLGPMGGLKRLVLQREDRNPGGSHKDRSAAVQAAIWAASGCTRATISSSGNAAIALGRAGKAAGIEIIALASPATATSKLQRIADTGARLILSDRAISIGRELQKRWHIPNLRPSVDDHALAGYKALALGFAEREDPAEGVFCYTSSGSTLVGMARGFQELEEAGWAGHFPGLHAAQTGTIQSIAEAFEEAVPFEGRSVVGDLGTRRTRRFGELVRALRNTGGHAWGISEHSLENARTLLSSRGITACHESCCAVAAALKAGERGRVQHALVLLTGSATHDSNNPEQLNAPHLDSVEEVASWLGLTTPGETS
jgi:threonine synthase